MIHLEAASADELWRGAARKIMKDGTPQPSRAGPTRELLHVGLTLTEPRQRIVFARDINPAFVLAEIIWILSGRDDLAFVNAWNPRMARYSDDGLTLHAAYGKRLRSTFGFDQLQQVYRALLHKPDTRQAVLQIWDPTTDLPNPAERAKDVPCNLVSHLMLRNGRLEWLQVMRSNDIVWGFPYNVAQFTALQEIMAGWLCADMGTYNHVSDSLHVYDSLVDELSHEARPLQPPHNAADLRMAYEEWLREWPEIQHAALRLTDAADAPAVRDTIAAAGVHPAYKEWLNVLAAERLRLLGQHETAADQIELAGSFWSASWRNWASRKRALARAFE